MADYNRYQGQQGSLYGMPYIISTQISPDTVAVVSPDGRETVTYLVVHPATAATLRPARPSVWVRVWRWLTQPGRVRRG